MSKKNKSVFVSAAGVLAGFYIAFANAFKNRGGTDEDLHQLLVGSKSEDFINEITDLAMKMVSVAVNAFRVVVNYGQSLAQMIQFGHYDWVNPDITEEHFPFHGQDQVELNIELVQFDKVMESGSEVLREFDIRGFQPATLPELLAFGAKYKYPEEQTEFPIVALGSIWRDSFGPHLVVCLNRDSSGRRLDTFLFKGQFSNCCRFVVVRR